MGAGSARCCSVSTPAKDVSRITAASGSSFVKSSSEGRVKPIKDFKIRYTEKGPVRKGCNVRNLVCTEIAHIDYVYRKLRLSDLVCQDMTLVAKHCNHLSALDHPHVTRFVDAFEDGAHLYLVYEKAHPLPLFEHIRERSSLTEEEAADYLRQVAMALSVAHSQGIVHGRMSPQSLILSYDDDGDDDVNTQIKVCDMGQGLVLRPSLLDSEATEKAFEVEKYALSPEVAWKDLVPNTNATLPAGAEKNDIWALGVIFYHMLSGTTPFKVDRRQDIVDQVVSKEVWFHDCMWSKLSPEAHDVVQSMLRVNPRIRISAAQILRHNWVKVAKTTFPRKRMVELLSNLSKNVNECEFKRFVLRVITEQLPRDGKTADTVEQAFRCLDRNGDGVLTVEEIIKGLKRHLQQSEGDQQLEMLFAQIDRDSSGTVNVQEFICASMSQKRSTSLPVLWEAFCAFDKDRSGSITFDEIDRIVKELEGAVLSPEQAAALAKEIRRELEEVDSNGSLDFDQFVYIMSNSSPNATDAFKKDMYRVLWGCGIDCYNVRHFDPSTGWDLTDSRPKSMRSAYRRKTARKRDADDLKPVSAG